jgi:hypothetical protein
MAKLSEQMLDAYMRGDKARGDALKLEIEKGYESNFDKPKTRQPDILKSNTVFNNDNSSALSIFKFLNKEFGEDWWEWEIETIDQMLWNEYGVVVDGVNRDKMLALRHLSRNDAAFFDWYEFNQLALSFGSAIADFEMLRRPSPGMIINAVDTMNTVRPDRESYFGEDVQKYIAISLITYGIYNPPPSLSRIISKEMDKLLSEDTKGNRGSVMKRYRRMLSGNTTVDESPVDIQARRLVVAEAAAKTY